MSQQDNVFQSFKDDITTKTADDTDTKLILLVDEPTTPRFVNKDDIKKGDDKNREEMEFHLQQVAECREKIGEKRLRQAFECWDRFTQIGSLSIKILEVITQLLLICYILWDVKTRTKDIN